MELSIFPLVAKIFVEYTVQQVGYGQLVCTRWDEETISHKSDCLSLHFTALSLHLHSQRLQIGSRVSTVC